jgi:hypothetical protein
MNNTVTEKISEKTEKVNISNNETTLVQNKSKNVTILLENNISYNINQSNNSKNNTESNKSIFHNTISKLNRTSKYLFESNAIFTHRFSLKDECSSVPKNLDYRYSTSTQLDNTNILNEKDDTTETKKIKKSSIAVISDEKEKSFVCKDGGSGWFVVIGKKTNKH